MGHVNSNDIDDLFKRASERYPLRTDSADWDRVAADLERDPSLILPPLNTGDDGRRRRRFFWLFLLLPLAGIGYYTWHAGHSKTKNIAGQTQAPVTATSHTTHENNTADGTGPSGNTPSPGAQDRQDKGAAAAKEGIVKEETGKTQKETNKVYHLGGPDQPAEAAAGANKGAGRTIIHGQSVIRTGRTGHGRQGAESRPGTQTGESTGSAAGNMTAESTGSTAVNTTVQAGQNKTAPLTLTAISAQRALIPFAYAVNISVKGKDNQASGTTPKKDNSVKKKKQSFFYAGLSAAPDLSTIKMQSVKGVGTTFGVLLGYQFNSRWAVETGIYDDRKKYYTEGDYFDKSKIGNLRYADLLNVDGICNMWEIPVNVRYNLSTGEKMKWFATAGLSTYLMTHENYDYQYTWNGGPVMTKSWQGANTSKYPFSVLNVSVGYEQRLGKIGNLRLEPYIRVPLGGIGTGNLPIMSAGLNIGLTRKLW